MESLEILRSFVIERKRLVFVPVNDNPQPLSVGGSHWYDSYSDEMNWLKSQTDPHPHLRYHHHHQQESVGFCF